jgi:hypothetical protein
MGLVSGWVTVAVVDGRVTGSDKFVVKRGAAAETPPCSESMRTWFAYFPMCSVRRWVKVDGNLK